MKWLNTLERKFGRFAIKNLMLYLVALYIIGFVFLRMGIFRLDQIALIPYAVKQGEFWRLFSFLLIPPTTDLIFFAFVLYFYYLIGSSLESIWGTFKFNIYILTGILGIIVGSMLSGAIMTTTYLNLSLFLAFARIYPDFQVNVFFVIPVKIKYLAWLNYAFYLYSFITGNLGDKIAIVLALGNFLLFFWSTTTPYSPKQTKRRREFKRQVKMSMEGARHQCTICGRTELDDENLEFRYCSKCEGNYEYCSDHLFNHDHIQKK